MVRDPDRPGVDGYNIRTLIMESSKEWQEWAKCLPPTEDIPTTHEQHVSHIQRPDGIVAIEITVRPKAGAVASEPDDLGKKDDAGLETAAARAGCDMTAFAKLGSKAKKIKAIREQREKTQGAVSQ